MSGIRGPNRASDSQSVFSSQERSHSRIVEIDSWMPSEIHAIPSTVHRLMRLIEGSPCVQGLERDVELALLEALGTAVMHGDQADPKRKVHIRCRCGPDNEMSMVVTHQGKGLSLGKTIGNFLTSEPAGENGCAIKLTKVATNEVSSERGSTEVHNGGTVLSSVSLKQA
jgi:anti-sigma regulatory factor (Ser/Thr protein kinase)